MMHWESARTSLDRARKLHDDHIVSDVDMEDGILREAEMLESLHKLAPATRRVVMGGACKDELRLTSWPTHPTSAISAAARAYDIPCDNVQK